MIAVEDRASLGGHVDRAYPLRLSERRVARRRHALHEHQADDDAAERKGHDDDQGADATPDSRRREGLASVDDPCPYARPRLGAGVALTRPARRTGTGPPGPPAAVTGAPRADGRGHRVGRPGVVVVGAGFAVVAGFAPTGLATAVLATGVVVAGAFAVVGLGTAERGTAVVGVVLGAGSGAPVGER